MPDYVHSISLSLVIPCYNEAGRIGLLYKGLSDFGKEWQGPWEAIIINDGSKDNTLQLLQSHPLATEYKNQIKIINQHNTGKGGALKAGVMAAQGDHILTLDADMASPPTELIKWIHLLGEHPDQNAIYIGSREHPDSEINTIGNRKAAGNMFNLIVRTLTPLTMHDTQCGFKFYPAPQAKRYFNSLHTYGWAHDVEILYKAHLDKVKIIEMPLQWNAIEGSKVNVLRDGIKMIWEVLRIVLLSKYGKKNN